MGFSKANEWVPELLAEASTRSEISLIRALAEMR